MAESLTERTTWGAGSLSAKYDEALLFAAQHHRDQMRKGSRVPYLSHLMAVSSLILENGGNESVAIAGLLHDAVEDAEDGKGGPVGEDIRRRFGSHVENIVLACSDGLDESGNRSGSWEDRKRPYLAGLPTKHPDALLVTAADKLHNARAIANDLDRFGPEFWDVFNACPHQSAWYYATIARAVAERLGHVHPIVRPLGQAVDALVAHVIDGPYDPAAGPEPCVTGRSRKCA